MPSCADELEATLRRPSRHRRSPHLARAGSRGFSSLLVHSGTPPMVFVDDQHYPFRVNAPFKLWAPLTDVPDCFVYFEPGRRPAHAVQPSARLLA